MNYFSDCKDIAEAKKKFRKLAFKYHPDKNDSEEAKGIMQEINTQYAMFLHEEGYDFEKFEEDHVDVMDKLFFIADLIGERFPIYKSLKYLFKTPMFASGMNEVMRTTSFGKLITMVYNDIHGRNVQDNRRRRREADLKNYGNKQLGSGKQDNKL